MKTLVSHPEPAESEFTLVSLSKHCLKHNCKIIKLKTKYFKDYYFEEVFIYPVTQKTKTGGENPTQSEDFIRRSTLIGGYTEQWSM